MEGKAYVYHRDIYKENILKAFYLIHGKLTDFMRAKLEALDD